MHELYEQAESLQNLLVSHATGGYEDNGEYLRLRQVLLSAPRIEKSLPQYVRTCRNLHQFWEFIKHKFGTYAERRNFIWDDFRPLLEILERDGGAPSEASISSLLEQFDASHVQAVWSKALDRKKVDPEGAITMARTLLESVCKHVLDDLNQAYKDGDDLPNLYKKASKSLNLAPSQHTEPVFKQILGGCTAIVEGLGSMRNQLGDAHGKGMYVNVIPAPRHAELAVNLSGAMAIFLIETLQKAKRG